MKNLYYSTIIVLVGFKLASKVKTLVALESFNFLSKFSIILDFLIFAFFFFFGTVSGQFLNCEGSGLYALQSSCKFNRSNKGTIEIWRFEIFYQGHFLAINDLQSA